MGRNKRVLCSGSHNRRTRCDRFPEVFFYYLAKPFVPTALRAGSADFFSIGPPWTGRLTVKQLCHPTAKSAFGDTV